MRGFVITIVSVSLIMLLIMLSNAINNNYKSFDRAINGPQALIYGAFVFDSVASDVNGIAGPGISFLQTNSSTGIIISGSIPQENYSGGLSDYEDFLEETVADQIHAHIDANFSNMSPGVLEIIINDDYTYENDPFSREMLFTKNGGTGATAYEVNITVAGTRANYSAFSFNGSGDMNVTVTYTDLNGTETESGKLFSDQINRMRVDYEDNGTVFLDIGSKFGREGSLWIHGDDADVSFSWHATLPPIGDDKKLGYDYDATMEYVQGDISISRGIGK